MKRKTYTPDPRLEERLAKREEARKRLAQIMNRADLTPYDRKQLEDANRVADFLARKPRLDPSLVFFTGLGALRSIRRANIIGDTILENPDDFGLEIRPYEGDARALASTLKRCNVRTIKEAEELARANFGARATITLRHVLAHSYEYEIKL